MHLSVCVQFVRYAKIREALVLTFARFVDPSAPSTSDKLTSALPDLVRVRILVCSSLLLDHYCDWIGNAVGAHNHRPFLAYLFFVVFHCALYLYMSYDGKPSTLHLLTLLALPSSNEVTVLKQIYEILQDDRVFSITIFKSIFFCLAMGMQLFQQLHFAAVNLTVNEALNGRRYSHFWVNGT